MFLCSAECVFIGGRNAVFITLLIEKKMTFILNIIKVTIINQIR